MRNKKFLMLISLLIRIIFTLDLFSGLSESGSLLNNLINVIRSPLDINDSLCCSKSTLRVGLKK